MVPPVASKSTIEMLSRISLAATTISGPLIRQAEFVVNAKFAVVGQTARAQRLPSQVLATLNNWAKVQCLAWNSGVNNTRRTCRHTLSLSHDYVVGLPALRRINIARLFNTCSDVWLHCGEPVCTSRRCIAHPWPRLCSTASTLPKLCASGSCVEACHPQV